MYPLFETPVLRCTQCNKPFDKEPTLKRHGYYCRTKTSGVTTRLRACQTCAKRKARCDGNRPNCLRCARLGLDCVYPSQAAASGSQSQARASNHLIATESLCGEGLDSLQALNKFVTLSGYDPDGPLPVIDHSGSTAFASDPSFFDWSALEGLLDNASRAAESLTPVSMEMLLDNRLTAIPPVANNSFNSIPSQTSRTTRTLLRRTRAMPSVQRTADLIFHTLRSYPRMLVRHNIAPPFVHAQLLSCNSKGFDTEPLNNCISLLQMISDRTRENRKLFWNFVRLECDRLYQRCYSMSRWELLSAMQALSFYLLIRLDEGETDHNNFDSQLIATVIAIATELNRRSEVQRPEFEGYDDTLDADWKDWIFLESCRRICVIYQIVNLLIYFEPALMCDHPPELVIAPLPGSRQLWEAADKYSWRREFEKDCSGRTSYGLAGNGDLVRTEKEQSLCGDPSLAAKDLRSAYWDEYCPNMDGFGSLVMLAASLIG